MRRRVVRVLFPYGTRTYSYRCSSARIGNEVLTEDGALGVVVGYGRRGYLGRLKRAQRIDTWEGD